MAQAEAINLQRKLDKLRTRMTALETALEEKHDDGATTTRWGLNRARLQRLKKRVASLEQAISRIDQGTYGICESCGKPINPDRLAILPDTKICIHCAQSDKQ